MKTLVTCFLSLLLIVSVVIPTYFILTEEKYEIATLADLGEEEENKGQETEKDFDIEVYYTYNNALLYENVEERKRISFYSRDYTSYSKKLLSPPPEFIA